MRNKTSPGGARDPQVAFLQKPFTSDELGRKVKELLSRSRES